MPETKTKKTLLAAVHGAAKTKARSDRMYDNCILTALKHGVTQTEVANAAGVSQAHVSRLAAANRQAQEARKAQRRSKRAKAGESL